MLMINVQDLSLSFKMEERVKEKKSLGSPVAVAVPVTGRLAHI